MTIDLDAIEKDLAQARAIPLEWSRNIATLNILAASCEPLIARVRELEAENAALKEPKPKACRHKYTWSINRTTGEKKEICDKCGAVGIVFQ